MVSLSGMDLLKSFTSHEPTGIACICKRPSKMLICSLCAYTTINRVKRICPVHPRVNYMYDISKCPKCSVHLKIVPMQEIDIKEDDVKETLGKKRSFENKRKF
uniref:Uncharacterized protein n=1 Tax=Clastoptera arizonana TaxID=38151 RepID=A0A1B6C5S6_9HEMI